MMPEPPSPPMDNPQPTNGAEPTAGGSPPLQPQRYINVMDDTANYLYRHGLIFLHHCHSTWIKQYAADYYDTIGTPGRGETLTISLVPAIKPLHGLPWARRPVTPDGAAKPRPGVGTSRLITGTVIFVCLGLAGIVVGLARTLGRTARVAIRNVPPLFVALIVVFTTSDSWKLFGTRWLDRRFYLLVIFCAATALYFLAKTPNEYGQDLFAPASEPTVEAMTSLVVRRLKSQPKTWYRTTALTTTTSTSDGSGSAKHLPKPWQELLDHEQLPTPPALVPKSVRVNIYILYLLNLLLILVAISIMIAAALVIVGVIQLNNKMITDLMGAAPHHLWTLPHTNITITRELVSVALSLGALCALFAAAGLHEPESRNSVMAQALARLRRLTAVYYLYQQAQSNAAELTGIQPATRPHRE